ncbi:78-dihydro-8-oxoguanine triphosphatase [Anaeramoeba ignava]|uniref:78-dihydro-8-oxoguanine triphosphatase n=1 Tax=Anaeramoeba ignava TaxID=1746090 RepID=A0A9Q0L7J2_ANAIG|nr:78-dihydro-8-oxoguanine triphosphatase [Anaeramoeba ignava]
MKLTTLCYLFRNERKEILLGLKKRGFGKNKYNGFGGKKEGNETIEETAKREFEEESGLKLSKMKRVGTIEFIYENKEEWDNKCAIFVSDFDNQEIKGSIQETEECNPIWFQVRDIPYSQMWEDDSIWLPLLIQGNDVFYRFFFDSNGKLLNGGKVDEFK